MPKKASTAEESIQGAKDALNCLVKGDIDEMKSLSNPPLLVIEVGKAMLILIEGELKDHSWGNFKKMIANPNGFI